MAHHNNRNYNQPQPFDMNALGQLNLGQLLQLLGTVDINQLMAMVSQIRVDPNDPNSVLKEDDPRIGLLQSLKAFLPAENSGMVDELIKTFTGKANK